MSLILLSILVFVLERGWKAYFSKNHHNYFTRNLNKHLKVFTLVADVLFVCGLSLYYIISSLEPVLLYFLLNFEEIPMILNSDSLRDILDTFIVAEASTSNFSLVSVVLLAYFSMMLVPTLLVATCFIIQSPEIARRVVHKSGIEKLPEILPRTKLFLKLCHLRN